MACGKKLVFLLLFSLPFSFQDPYRQLYGEAVYDYVLLGYRIASFNTMGSFSCAHRCLAHDKCKSYNYDMSAAQQGLCELNSGTRDESKHLEYKPGFVYVEAVLKKLAKPSKSCFDHWKLGARTSQIYHVHDDSEKTSDVYCDFSSEPGWIWTLVISQSFANREMPEFKSTPFFEDSPVSEDNPNWKAYRLSLEKMKDLRSQSTHCRVTCSFPTYGVDYTDYVRANISEFDPILTTGKAICKKVEYMNVRGHECSGCTSAWWQVANGFLHHDSSFALCEFKETPGSVSGEDNFGSYGSTNPNFRCTMTSQEASTNHWFGRRA